MEIQDIYSNLPTLETERIILRKLRSGDERDIFQYASDPVLSKYTVWDSHKSIEDTRVYLNKVLDKYNRLDVSPWGVVAKKTNKVIGTTGFISWNIPQSRAELGYALSRDYWNQGFMTEAVREVLRFGFGKMNLIRIEARCHPDNIGSARVMEKAGMLFEGILRKHILAKGKHEDVKMYSIIRDEFEDA